MHWNSLSEFILMGGYGKYVWGSFGVTFVLLTAEVVMLRARKRKLEQGAGAKTRPEAGNSKLETVL